MSDEPVFTRPKSLMRDLAVLAVQAPPEWVLVARYPTRRGAHVAAARYHARALELGLEIRAATNKVGEVAVYVRKINRHKKGN